MTWAFMPNDCLFRLLNSEYCDAYLALYYLFHSKDVEVLEFLGQKLFDLPNDDVDFFLPQLLHLYVCKMLYFEQCRI